MACNHKYAESCCSARYVLARACLKSFFCQVTCSASHHGAHEKITCVLRDIFVDVSFCGSGAGFSRSTMVQVSSGKSHLAFRSLLGRAESNNWRTTPSARPSRSSVSSRTCKLQCNKLFICLIRVNNPSERSGVCGVEQLEQ